ncbi:gephyrin-like molybdotransferase Glp [Shewanella sp. NIFS-20-20]|uniref:molybdopterin molybdotransferase MoeA n=1 Tax=Shewanella sp. NIFS-20-20 TaxID=2853806 RepID=UPI001C451D13|nr:gephyrin-like molybdotransferase Glp [Shewanella sp. NIFS-20-20]MBV7316683.1 molybdopterin molybdenumtransferase MoeA [Shewanella sp. NIFS-20-20]
MSTSHDPCCQPDLLHPDAAIPLLLGQVNAITATEVVQLPQALGRVLAEDLVSAIDLPPFANSSMDGFAFRYANWQPDSPLTLVGQSFAGHPYQGQYQAGTCIRIMTGAPVPTGYDSVQMQELAQVDGTQVTLAAVKGVGENVRQRGEELSQGTKVLTQGCQIGAAEMGVLATIGVPQLKVLRRLKVAFFSTGDELMPVGSELGQGQIYDSNRYSLQGLLSRAGVDWLDLGVIKDDPEAIRQAFMTASREADLVLTSGGVSVGEADYTKQILDEEGQITFWKLAIKPGKPFAFGHIAKAIFCGLPGNPVSSMVTFYKIVMPVIHKLQGLPPQPVIRINAELQQAIRKHPGRVEYQRGILTTSAEGVATVATTGSQGSGMLTSMTLANCFIVLDQMQGDTPAGTQVIVEPFNYILD